MTERGNCGEGDSSKTFLRFQIGQINVLKRTHPMLGCLRHTLRTVDFSDGRQKRRQFPFRFRKQTGVSGTGNSLRFKVLFYSHHVVFLKLSVA